MGVDTDAETGRDGSYPAVNDTSTSRVSPTRQPGWPVGNPGMGFEGGSTFKKKGIVIRTRVNGSGAINGGIDGEEHGLGAGVVGGEPAAEGESESDPCSPTSPASPASMASSSSHDRGKQSLTKKLVSRVRALKELFGLDLEDDSEELIDTFMCALKKRILLQGRMYVFTKHVCFSCSLFGYHKLKTIPIASILSVRKKKHVGFPNSVEILWREHAGDVQEKREFFTSFLSREEAFRMIIGLWDADQGGNTALGQAVGATGGVGTKSKESDKPRGLDNESSEHSRSASHGSSTDGAHSSRPGTGHSQPDKTVNSIHTTNTSTTHETSSALDPMLGEARHEELLSSFDRTQSAGEILTPRGRGHTTEFASSSAVGVPEADGNDGPLEKLEAPPEVPPIMQKVMEYVIPVQPQEFYDLFLSSRSEFFIDYHSAQGHKNIELSSWDHHGSMGPVRDLSFVTALKGFRIGPPEALCHQTQRVGVYAGSHIVFETSQVMNDIPYGDHFKVETRWDIFPTSEGSDIGSNVHSESSSKMIIHIAVPFTKNTMFKKFIEKGVTDSLLEAYQMFKRLAAQRLEAAENDDETASDGVQSSLSIRSSRSVKSDALAHKPHNPEDLLPQQEEDWEMMLERVEPKFRSGLASLRKMQQEVARQNKFSLTKSKHRRNTSIIDNDALDAIISDFEGEIDDNVVDRNGVVDGRPSPEAMKSDDVSNTHRPLPAPHSWLTGIPHLDARDRTYISMIVILLAVVVAQSCILLGASSFHHVVSK